MIIVSVEADRAIYFGVAAVAGMMYEYTNRWYGSDTPKTFTSWGGYIFGDFGNIFVALKALVILCVGAGGFEYLSSLPTMHILGAGAYIGTLVPQTVDNGAGNAKIK